MHMITNQSTVVSIAKNTSELRIYSYPLYTYLAPSTRDMAQYNFFISLLSISYAHVSLHNSCDTIYRTVSTISMHDLPYK